MLASKERKMFVKGVAEIEIPIIVMNLNTYIFDIVSVIKSCSSMNMDTNTKPFHYYPTTCIPSSAASGGASSPSLQALASLGQTRL